ncbi:hypothetical protein KAR91_57260 [Candidatus Pacearchaeota archaeon]|nr:hypothetical protein [Candidatus Pacearchaeota archaeon]
MITQGYMDHKCEDDLSGFATFDQDRTAKIRLCDIARHPEKLLSKSESIFTAYLLTIFRRFTVSEAMKIGRIFVRKVKATEAEVVEAETVEQAVSVFDDDNGNKGFFNEEELAELNRLDGIILE